MAAALTSPGSPSQVQEAPPVERLPGPPHFDLETYLQNYTGRTQYDRLALICQRSSFLGLDALKTAVKVAKEGRDVERFEHAVAALETEAPQEAESANDIAWVSKMKRDNQQDKSRLEAELKGYKNNLIKESIRIANEEIGLLLQSTGDLNGAVEAFTRMRADVMVAKHIVDCNKHLVNVAIEQGNWQVAKSHATKIRGHMSSPEDDKTNLPYVQAVEALTHLELGDYQGAADLFLATQAGMGAICNTFLSPNDVAVYGGICALATMNRSELQSRVLDNSSFRSYLELEPHIRRAVAFFVNSRYSACLGILESYRTDYLLDLYLHKHVEALYTMVRSKSIQQYFIPFSCVTIQSLNEAFAPPGRGIEKELESMIQRGDLNARIDMQDGTLVCPPTSTRSQLYINALNTAREYEKETRRRILHVNIAAADLEVKGGMRRRAATGEGMSASGMAMDEAMDLQSRDWSAIGMGGLGNMVAGAAGLFKGQD